MFSLCKLCERERCWRIVVRNACDILLGPTPFILWYVPRCDALFVLLELWLLITDGASLRVDYMSVDNIGASFASASGVQGGGCPCGRQEGRRGANLFLNLTPADFLIAVAFQIAVSSHFIRQRQWGGGWRHRPSRFRGQGCGLQREQTAGQTAEWGGAWLGIRPRVFRRPNQA